MLFSPLSTLRVCSIGSDERFLVAFAFICATCSVHWGSRSRPMYFSIAAWVRKYTPSTNSFISRSVISRVSDTGPQLTERLPQDNGDLSREAIPHSAVV